LIKLITVIVAITFKKKDMPKQILIIDDEQDLLDIMEIYFKDEGFKVKTTAVTDDIFKMVDSYQPDLIILDYQLKEVNGGEICYLLKEHPETKHLPVIIFSASAKAVHFFDKYKCDLFIAKPFDLFHLIDQVKLIINTQPILVNT
jgi:DNA-binding response OmpR family regulator